MIARQHQHYDHPALRRLLDDELPADESSRMEEHLAGCAQCREEIEQLAAQRSWWHETVDVLTASTAHSPSPEPRRSDSPSPSLEASIEWIRPLLDPTERGSGQLGQLDQYEIHEIIGQGGMGVVLRGFDPELNRPVAIKVLSPHLAGVGAARARFMREAQAAATIVHPSIVPIYSVVTSSRLPYIVMPCINGGNLQERIDREGPLDLVEVLRIGAEVADGLTAAHRQGVIHRDIKPANILIDEGNGRVLISDFGLARALDDATLTISGMIAGTPQYMSPEQARGEVIDARSDLFSLGSLLYALATGRPPYRAESPLAVLRKISDSKPKPIHQVNELMPTWFDQMVGKLMTIEPAQRIASADDAAAMLRDGYAHVRNPAVHALPHVGRPGRLRSLAFALPATVLVCAAVSTIAFAPKVVNSLNNSLTMPRGEVRQEQQVLTAGASAAESTTSRDSITRFEWSGDEVRSELASIDETLTHLEQAIEMPAMVNSPSTGNPNPDPESFSTENPLP